MRNIYLSLFILISTPSFACDCDWGENFMNASLYAELITKIEVVDIHYNFKNGNILSSKNSDETSKKQLLDINNYDKSLKVKVVQIIRGVEASVFVEIYGNNGYDCRESVHRNFKIGDIFIVNLQKVKIRDNFQLNEDNEDYAIDGCSENWVKFNAETDEVFGYIKGDKRKKKEII
jgi:hypothetical protein